MRTSYSNGELALTAWIPGGINPTDLLTKLVVTKSSPLWKLMKENPIGPKRISWASITLREARHGSGQLSIVPNTLYRQNSIEQLVQSTPPWSSITRSSHSRL